MAVVIMVHGKVDRNMGKANSPGHPELSTLVNSIRTNVKVTGHSHTRTNPATKVNGKMINDQAREYSLGQTEVSMKVTLLTISTTEMVNSPGPPRKAQIMMVSGLKENKTVMELSNTAMAASMLVNGRITKDMVKVQ